MSNSKRIYVKDICLGDLLIFNLTPAKICLKKQSNKVSLMCLKNISVTDYQISNGKDYDYWTIPVRVYRHGTLIYEILP